MSSIQNRAAFGLALLLANAAVVTAQPASFDLVGIVRDVRASTEPGGHLDFETLQQFQEGVGPKIYCINLVAPTLGANGLPRLNGRWHSQASGVSEQLLDVDFVTPNIGYAVGMSGRVLKTTDGGATWVPSVILNVAGLPVASLRAVDFTTPLRGFAAGATAGKIYETADGGATWQRRDVTAGGSTFHRLQIPGPTDEGFAAANGGRIFYRDPVLGWVARNTLLSGVTPLDIRAMSFPLGVNRGVAVGRLGAIATTINGFSGYTVITGPANPAAGVVDLHDVHFLNNNHGYAVGSAGWILRSTTGGATWTRVGIGATAQDLCGVHVVDANTTFVVGVAGTTLASRDGGLTWGSLACDATDSLNSVCFPLGTVGFAVGDNGAIERFGAGHLITAPWTDSAGNPICPLLYNAALGDVAGTYGNPYFERIHSEAGFAQWYTDVPGVNISKVEKLTFRRQLDGTYLFDSATDEPHASRGGFFPFDNGGFGNYGGTAHNYHFTFHMQATFDYDAAGGQMLRFMGDDDVWVFIDGKLVIDVGGRHPAREQYVRMNRLALANGQSYTMDFFSAERQTFGSNIRIQTNVRFKAVAPKTISASWD